MEIKIKIYSCYKLTYSKVCDDIIKRIYGQNIDFKNVIIEIEDISENNTLNIQQQRSIDKYITRTVRIYEDNILKHIVGMSNTNYDYDKDAEFKSGKSIKSKNSFGKDGYHANTYLLQGINRIFDYYFENKSTADLTFYLLDIERTYPHNLYNVLSYRELETIGFKILNLDRIDFKRYQNCCNSVLSYSHISFSSFNKFVRDIAYISKQNSSNTSSFLTCKEEVSNDENGGSVYTVEKYIYTFKSLSAQGYDSFLRCWCMKVLATKENVDIEFRLGKQYFAYEQNTKQIASDLTEPIKQTLKNAGIVIEYVTDDTFMKETSIADDTYLRYKQQNQLRNQTLFRNNIRKKGIPTECAICGEDNTSILDAAHIWEVNRIKNASNYEINEFIASNQLSDLISPNSKYKNELFFKKYSLVNSGDNGIWLCKNHHGLFDKNYFCFDGETGKVLLYFKEAQDAADFAKDLKEDFSLPDIILNHATKSFIIKRQLCFTA